MGLTDEEAQERIDSMVTFINVDSDRKVDEINAKAEEEFNIEKSNYIKLQNNATEKFYEKMERQMAAQNHSSECELKNASNIYILTFRDGLIDDVFSGVRNKLKDKIRDDEDLYRNMLINWMLQGLLVLLEQKVILRIREKDKNLIREIIPEVLQKYQEAVDKTAKVVLDGKSSLSDDSIGGIEMFSGRGKIKLKNTFDEKINLLRRLGLPFIRLSLFGVNEGRKFFDEFSVLL